MTNFTTQDATGALQAIFGFGALLLSPGYLVAAAVDLFGFRRRSRLERLAWGIALSFAISPLSTALLGPFIPMQALAAGFALGAAAMLVLWVVEPRQVSTSPPRETLLLGLLLVFAAAVVVGELVDIQRGSRLYLSVTVLDQAYRVAFTNAIAHAGLPPVNPLYHPGSAAPLRYYYFWYALCAVCMKLAHVSARQALIASSVWVGLGLTALIALIARHFLNVRTGVQRFVLVATLLLTVTGLDIMPVLFNLLVNHDFSGDLEWWSTDQVASWLDSILWVPNHVAALLCCVLALLLLWRSRESQAPRQRLAAILLAGVAAASALGLSLYVAAGFAILMLAWTLVLLPTDRAFAVRNAAAAGVGVVLSIPFLRQLATGHSGTQGGEAAGPTHVFQLSVRKMIDSGLITGLPVFASLNREHPVLLDQFVRLLLLIPGYVLELGVFGVVLVQLLRERKQLDSAHRTAVYLALGGLVLVSVLRSSVIGNNDFGYRAALLPCFLLLLLTAERLTSARAATGSSRHTVLLSLLILVGVAGTAFQALMLRAFVPLHVAAGMPAFAGLPEAAFAERTVYADTATVIASDAVLQPNLLDPQGYLAASHMLYSERLMATDAQVDCGAVFGGNPARCGETQQAVRSLFALPSPTPAYVLEVCRSLGIHYLSVSDSDPVWQDRKGWVWTLPLAVRNHDAAANDQARVRIVDCAPEPLAAPQKRMP